MNAVPLTLLLGVWLASSGPGWEEWPGVTWVNQPPAWVTAAGRWGVWEWDLLPGAVNVPALVRLSMAGETRRDELTPGLLADSNHPAREGGNRWFKSEEAVVPGNQNQVLAPAKLARYDRGVRRNPGLRKPQWVLPHTPAVRLKVPGL
jgi:hypothetical protein